MICSSLRDWFGWISVPLLVVIAVALKGLSFSKKANRKTGSSRSTARVIRKTVYEMERD